MLMKLTPLANFINMYKFFVRMSFFYVHVTREKLPKRRFVRKIRTFNVDDIDTLFARKSRRNRRPLINTAPGTFFQASCDLRA